MREGLFAAKGRLDNSCRMKGTMRRWLGKVSKRSVLVSSKQNRDLPLGFGEVSMVYRSFIV